MKRLMYVLTVACLSVGVAAQQQMAAATGLWEVEDQPAWGFELMVNGTTLTGKVRQGGQEILILDGTVAGDTVTFKAKSPDGDRTITFIGTMTDDVITFKRTVEIVEGGAQGGAGLMGGTNGPTEFRARRALERWTGTARNAPTRRTPNPNPTPRLVALGVRKVADPHWRWRGGEKDMTVRTFIQGNQSLPLNFFELTDDRLTFSYSRPGPGDEVQCLLARQPGGVFSGVCEAGNGNLTQLIELTPPGTAGGQSDRR